MRASRYPFSTYRCRAAVLLGIASLSLLLNSQTAFAQAASGGDCVWCDRSALLQLFSAFGLGFLSSFTPCVFPLIPITLSLFGVRGDLDRWRRFLLSLTYVAGIACTYTALGILSAKTGAVFGSFLGNQWVVITLILFMTALAMFTLDLFQIPALSKLQTAASKVGGAGHSGAFLMGAVSGVVAAPCVGPALVLILGIAASSQSLIWGGALLLAYSLGLGLIFLALGTFSGIARALPRAGNWMFTIKFVMAAALLMVALFLGQRLFAGTLLALNSHEHMLALLAIEHLGILLAWLAVRRGLPLLKFLSALMVAVALYEIVLPDPLPAAKTAASVEQELFWHISMDEALAEGKARGKIVMIDLFADWCAACKELESLTFPDPSVRKELLQFSLGRIDFTDTETPEALAITEKYKVPGLPCILFLDSASGDEIPSTRITGFMPPEEFSAHLQMVLNRGS